MRKLISLILFLVLLTGCMTEEDRRRCRTTNSSLKSLHKSMIAVGADKPEPEYEDCNRLFK